MSRDIFSTLARGWYCGVVSGQRERERRGEGGVVLSYLVTLDEGQVHGLGDELADSALPTAGRARDNEEVVVRGGIIGSAVGSETVRGGLGRGLHHGRTVLVGQHPDWEADI